MSLRLFAATTSHPLEDMKFASASSAVKALTRHWVSCHSRAVVSGSICFRFVLTKEEGEKVRWARSENDAAVGDACLVCKKTVQAWPNMQWSEAVLRRKSKDTDFSYDFNLARCVAERLLSEKKLTSKEFLVQD
eukprot:6465170-Amphidinium_carterae.1